MASKRKNRGANVKEKSKDQFQMMRKVQFQFQSKFSLFIYPTANWYASNTKNLEMSFNIKSIHKTSA